MLPASIVAKAVQLCAMGLNAAGAPGPFAIGVRTGAVLTRVPANQAEAEATIRDLLALGADFEAGPLRINGRDFSTFKITPASVFDPCALAHTGEASDRIVDNGGAEVSSVSALLRRTFDARITNTIRPMNASYGARYSWHKFGQAIDFVPAAGVGSITRAQLRSVMEASGFQVIELLGPGDRGHSNHWHLAFARSGQVIDQPRRVEDDEEWMINVAGAGPGAARVLQEGAAPALTAGLGLQTSATAPPQWDVFAAAEWRANQRGGS
ncbi:muramidase [Sphingomonas ginsenosidivorax]|uniref:Muramidase n=1 Tax=Sphingomonas ginsenosidivorax TaxID=862135 RepID=A0A5C6U5F6_9SPHN|nr:muramidase [Sphingomonas ginsenosidivorax]